MSKGNLGFVERHWNRWSRGDRGEGDQFGESVVDLERQRLGRVGRERKNAILYRTLLMGVCEQGCGTGWEVGEMEKEPTRLPKGG